MKRLNTKIVKIGYKKLLRNRIVEFIMEDQGVKYEVWCDNYKSFELKQDLVNKFGYRGISVWALGQEDKRIWKTLK